MRSRGNTAERLRRCYRRVSATGVLLMLLLLPQGLAELPEPEPLDEELLELELLLPVSLEVLWVQVVLTSMFT